MGRTSAFRRLLRVAGIADACDARGLTSREGVEMAREARSRRDFLRAAGAAAAGVAATGVLAPGLARAVKASDAAADIAIVGGGLAGLACAYELRRKGVIAGVYEASDRVGGRCQSLSGVFPGQTVELGGELIDTLHKTMLGYANELGLPLESYTKVPGDTFWHLDGALRHEAEIVDEWRDFVPVIRGDLQALSGEVTADAFTAVDVGYDYLDLATYLDDRGAGPILRAALEAAYGPEYGREIGEQSCLNLLFFIHADRRSKFREFGVFSGERYHIVGGNGQIPEQLGAALGGAVELGMALTALRRTPAGRYVMTFASAGGAVVEREADAVVLALPFSILRGVALDASLELPPSKVRAIDELVYGTNSKLMLGFDARPWRDLGGSGAAYGLGLDNLQNTWETNPSFVGPSSVLTDFSGGLRGAALDPADLQGEAESFLADVEAVFPGAAAAATRLPDGSLRAVMKHWPSEPWQLGSYVCNHPGYFTTIAGHEAKRVGNLLFAGEHTDSFYAWQGFMEGAAASGVRVAKELLHDLRKKSGGLGG